jgi:3',5'-cyclic-AMP phosphodiesterase
MTRRNILSYALAATGMAVLWPRRAACSAITGAGRLRFVFCTDVHAAPQPRIASALERAAASIRSRDAVFVIVGGDLISGGYTSSIQVTKQHWDAYMRFHEQLGTKVWPVLGNHDLVGVDPADGSRPEADPRQVFKDRLGLDRTWYSFDAGGYHFMVLDSVRITTDEYRYHGYISLEQREWIMADLAGYPKQTPIILISHLPLWTRFFETYDVELGPAPPHRVVTNAAQVLSLFADRNLILVLQGHLHIEELLRREATRFITGGAISGNWWQGDRHGTPPGYGLITLEGQEVRWEYCAAF